MPLRHRRLALALRYLRYLISLPRHSYARCALEDSLDLARAGCSSWVGDLAVALFHLTPPVTFDFRREVDADLVGELLEAVKKSS